ncbi:hypothetical protein QPK87_35910 [Kamptonema cortianum]|nr:hypothetical protein [Kamptonema cortianum]
MMSAFEEGFFDFVAMPMSLNRERFIVNREKNFRYPAQIHSHTLMMNMGLRPKQPGVTICH